jgi:predicted DNA binding CopG/RHH family protein
MKIPNDINELNGKKLTNAFDLDVPVDELKKETANEDSDEFEKEIVFSRKRDKLIHVRMTKEEKITIEMMAEYHHLPVSAYIRALVKQDMRRQRQVNKVKDAGGSVD